ncbi:MAG TPA: response regulator [Clostridia bacterium]|nr:response regulator [Clostridia bacterium]
MKVYILDEGSSSLDQMLLWLSGNPKISAVELYSDCSRFISRVMELPPTLCIIRLGYEGTSGLKTAKIIKNMYPNILIIFTSEERGYALDAYELGANGYLLCPTDKNKFEKCLRLGG